MQIRKCKRITRVWFRLVQWFHSSKLSYKQVCVLWVGCIHTSLSFTLQLCSLLALLNLAEISELSVSLQLLRSSLSVQFVGLREQRDRLPLYCLGVRLFGSSAVKYQIMCCLLEMNGYCLQFGIRSRVFDSRYVWWSWIVFGI